MGADDRRLAAEFARNRSEDDGLLRIGDDGDVLRFMWDYTVRIPLWGRGGLITDDPGWLRRVLGLSDSLINDLVAWGDAMNHLDAHLELRAEQAYEDLDEQARALVARLREEIGSRFRIDYVPW